MTDVKVGNGTNLGITIKSNPSVTFHDIISVEYTGKFADGKVFDTNVPGAKGNTDIPLVVLVGQTPVIPAWTQGVIGMKIGGERKLDVPAALGYGAAGSPPNITTATVTYNGGTSTLTVTDTTSLSDGLKLAKYQQLPGGNGSCTTTPTTASKSNAIFLIIGDKVWPHIS